MRIDNLNRSLHTPETEKTGAVQADWAKTGETSASAANSPDAASISQLASSALDPAASARSAKTDEARLEALRVQIERGEYNVSAEQIAASIIDQHIIG